MAMLLSPNNILAIWFTKELRSRAWQSQVLLLFFMYKKLRYLKKSCRIEREQKNKGFRISILNELLFWDSATMFLSQ